MQSFLTWVISPLLTEVFPRDLRQKERFLKHLTGEQMPVSLCTFLIPFVNWQQFKICLFEFFAGPLYFSPKCSKHFYKLYHNTRDCTIPACKCHFIQYIYIISEAISMSVTYWSEIYHFNDCSWMFCHLFRWMIKHAHCFYMILVFKIVSMSNEMSVLSFSRL